jgi:hypothetical protein
MRPKLVRLFTTLGIAVTAFLQHLAVAIWVREASKAGIVSTPGV